MQSGETEREKVEKPSFIFFMAYQGGTDKRTNSRFSSQKKQIEQVIPLTFVLVYQIELRGSPVILTSFLGITARSQIDPQLFLFDVKMYKHFVFKMAFLFCIQKIDQFY